MSPSLFGGWSKWDVSTSVGSDCGAWLRLHSTVGCAGNDKRATGRSDAVLAVDEGNSSKGVKSVAGKAPRVTQSLGTCDGSGKLETQRTSVR